MKLKALVLGAAVLVARTGSAWPDLLVGVSIAALFAQSGWGVLREAIIAMRVPTAGRRVGS